MTPTQTLIERPKNLFGLLQIINRWKYPVIGLTVLAAIISAAISLVLPNEYKSATVFFPTNLRTVDPDRIIKGEKMEVENNPEDLDRIITIGQSQPLAEYIINEFQLYRDYGLENMNDDESKQYALDQFSANLNIVHNEQDVIELTFMSKDKERAATVANAVVKRIDFMNQQLMLENREKVVSIFKDRYLAIDKIYTSLRDSLQRCRKKYGVFGYEKEDRSLGTVLAETQTELYKAKGEYESLSNQKGADEAQLISLKARIRGLENALEALTQNKGNSYNAASYFAGSDLVYALSLQVKELTTPYIYAKTSYEDAKVGINGKISTLYIVQKAYPAMRKAKPIRWLIVASSTMLTFFLAVIFVALFELYKRESARLSF